MSLHHKPRIVTDSLECYIDIANKKCASPTSSELIDITGNGNNGRILDQNKSASSLPISGKLEYDTSDIETACLDFITSGSDQCYVEFLEHPLAGKGQYTIESWFKIKGAMAESQYNIIFYSSAPDANFQELGMLAQNTTSDPDISYEIDNNFTGGDTNVRAGEGWNHFVMTFDGAISKLYLNGEFRFTRDEGSDNILPSTGWDWIGIGQFQSTGGGFTNGKLSTLSLYSKALSEQEVKQNFNALRGRFGI